MKNEYWKKFEETGFVKDYLNYIETKYEYTVDKEGVRQNESGAGDGHGIVRDADWGIR